MLDQRVLSLQSSIEGLPGVLGCVIVTDGHGNASEIQAFSGVGIDRDDIQQQILEEAQRRNLDNRLERVFVFELDAETPVGDREALRRAADVADNDARSRGSSQIADDDPSLFARAKSNAGPARPPLQRVVLTSSAWTAQAEVALGAKDSEILGQAVGTKTPHGLRVVAEAALEAVGKLVGGTALHLVGASLVNLVGREAILVLVDVEGFGETVGAALVRGGPIPEAGVRATLDAVNRKLAHHADAPPPR